MIEERALCAAMKAAWKWAGYEVYAAEDTLVITTDEMGVEMSRRNVSRKVLSLLALHLGEIPDGTAYSVRKDDVQQEMLDVAMSHWDGVRNRVDGAERRVLRRTPMSWKHRGVWQEEGTGTVHTFDEDLANIIVAEPDGIEIADGLMLCDDGGGLAVVYPAEGVMAEAVRNLLEQVTLA